VVSLLVELRDIILGPQTEIAQLSSSLPAHRQIWTVDFTQHQTGISCKFHDFIVVIATKEKLKVPDSLQSLVIKPEKPLSSNKIDPEINRDNFVKPRRTKQEIQSTGM